MNGAGARRGLSRRYGLIAAYTGLISAIVAVVVASPVLVVPAFPEDAGLVPRVLLPAVVLGLPGLLLWRRFAPVGPPTLSPSEASAVVVLSWFFAVATATGSFLLLTELTPLQALFEATSALTTTGLSVVDVTKASATVLFLRSVLELAGGAGLAILMISLTGGPLGAGLSSAEGRSEQLVPNVVNSATIIVRMYAVYALVGTLGLWAAGMSGFDAVNHAFAAVSTGGFSTRPESIGYWDSAAVEAVTLVLMILGTTNFLVAWSLVRGRWREVLGSGEFRLMAVVVPAACVALAAVGVGGLYASMGKAARVIVFEVVSALSTTGFSTVAYGDWPVSGWLVLTGLMLVGGGAGSTAGGLKQARVYVLWRAARFEVARALMPLGAVNRPLVQSGSRTEFLEDAQVARTGAFLFVYMGTFALGAFVMLVCGVPFPDAVFEMASSLGTVGLSVGVTGASTPDAVLATQVVAMMLGRLEFFVIGIGLLRLLGDGWAVTRAVTHRRRGARAAT